MLDHLRIDSIDANDLQGLVDSGVRELRRMEYKSRLPGKGIDERKEFLADVTSFANTEGGDLVYGIETDDGDKGMPKRLVGIESCDWDRHFLTHTDHTCAQPSGHTPIPPCHRPTTPYGPVVIATAQSDLTPASMHFDASLLSTFIQTRYDLHRTAQLTQIPVPDLLTWLTDARTQRTLDDLRAAAEQSLALRAIEAKRTALDALEEVVTYTDDLVEKRRAATALLRALNTRTNPSREHTPPESPPMAECQVPSAPLPSASLSNAMCPVPCASPPPPLSSLLSQLTAALTTDDPDAPTADNALAALHAACAEDATLDDRPIPAEVDDFIADADGLHHLRPIAHVDVATPTHAHEAAATRLTLTHHDATSTTLAMAFALEDARWQIVAIVTEPEDTS